MLISGKYWKIKLNRYETKARIGAYQHERLLPQRLRLNVSVYVEKGAAPVNELSEVFNYDRIIEAIEAVVQEGHIDLQETLLERTAERLLACPRNWPPKCLLQGRQNIPLHLLLQGNIPSILC